MKVIFHGEDFGLTSGINEGIIQSFKQGLLSSTSLVASGEAAEEAMSLAKENPELDMGIHLILSDELPVLPPGYLSSIISKGDTLPARGRILDAILTRRIDYGQVEAEWRAQIEKLLSAEILITHINSHQFIHLYPGLLPICLRLAVSYDIPYVRTSILDTISLEFGFKRLLHWISLKLWIRFFVSRTLSPHVRGVPSMGFLQAGGKMSHDTIFKTLDRLKRQRSCSTIEVMLHPGTGDEYTSLKYSHWRYNWKKDLELLLDHSFADMLDRRGVVLTSYGEQL